MPKYLNSPETPIYTKGRTLYGLDVTKGAIRKHNYCVLVEGYFDLAQVWQAGVQPVVAVVRHGADQRAGPAAETIHVESRPEFRSGRGRPGRGGAVVGTAGGRRVSGQRGAAAGRERPGHVHPAVRRPGVRGTADGVAAVSGVPARSGGGGPGPEPPGQPEDVSGRDADRGRDDSGRGRPRSVRGSAGAQGADYRSR